MKPRSKRASACSVINAAAAAAAAAEMAAHAAATAGQNGGGGGKAAVSNDDGLPPSSCGIASLDTNIDEEWVGMKRRAKLRKSTNIGGLPVHEAKEMKSNTV
jgi:hypothetical protein